MDIRGALTFHHPADRRVGVAEQWLAVTQKQRLELKRPQPAQVADEGFAIFEFLGGNQCERSGGGADQRIADERGLSVRQVYRDFARCLSVPERDGERSRKDFVSVSERCVHRHVEQPRLVGAREHARPEALAQLLRAAGVIPIGEHDGVDAAKLRDLVEARILERKGIDGDATAVALEEVTVKRHASIGLPRGPHPRTRNRQSRDHALPIRPARYATPGCYAAAPPCTDLHGWCLRSDIL